MTPLTPLTPVLVDVDDTIADTQVVLLESINSKLGTEYTFDQMTREHREGSDDHKEWREAVWDLLKQPDVMRRCEPSEGALRAMMDLWGSFKVHIVSARQEPLHEITEQWLYEHGFMAYVDAVHPRPTYERGSEFKVRVAREQGFEAAFEDTFDVASALAEVVPHVFLIDKPWNRGHDHDLPENVVRADSFEDGVRKLLADVENIYGTA